MEVTCISVRQPFAHQIIYRGKDIENRTWRTNYRGRLYIHASMKPFGTKIEPAMMFGGLIGYVELVDVVTHSKSLWFEGPFGWVLRDPQSIEFVPMRGQQNLFKRDI